MTINFKRQRILVFFAIFGCGAHLKGELHRKG